MLYQTMRGVVAHVPELPFNFLYNITDFISTNIGKVYVSLIYFVWKHGTSIFIYTKFKRPVIEKLDICPVPSNKFHENRQYLKSIIFCYFYI